MFTNVIGWLYYYIRERDFHLERSNDPVSITTHKTRRGRYHARARALLSRHNLRIYYGKWRVRVGQNDVRLGIDNEFYLVCSSILYKNKMCEKILFQCLISYFGILYKNIFYSYI